MLIPLTRTSGKVYNNNIEGALKVLKRKVKDSNLLVELRQRQYYEKPTLKRQRRHKENLKRVAKLNKQREREGF